MRKVSQLENIFEIGKPQTLDSILTGLAENKQDASKRFCDLAEKISTSQPVAISEVERILKESNKTQDDLRKAVDLFNRKQQILADIDRDTGLEAEAEELRKRIADATAEFTPIQQAHRDKVSPWQYRLAEIRDARGRIATRNVDLHRVNGQIQQMADTTTPRYELDENGYRRRVDSNS